MEAVIVFVIPSALSNSCDLNLNAFCWFQGLKLLGPRPGNDLVYTAVLPHYEDWAGQLARWT